MTGAQRKVYEFVAAFLNDNGYAPTIREIGDGLGLASSSTVHMHLAALVNLGYLAGSGRRLKLGWRSGQDAGVG